MQNAVVRALAIATIASTLGVAQSQPSFERPAAPPLLKKLVSFLTVEYQDGTKIGTIRGTAFFVSLADKRLGENRGFFYLVTNRHMASPIIDGRAVTVRKTSIRVNLKNPIGGALSAEGELLLGPTLQWYFPKDDAVDLAVLPIALDQDKFDYEAFPTSLFATRDFIQSDRISEGDSVLFTGFFYQFPGQKKIEPIVRQGILAMIPEELLETTLRKPGRLYLADVHVFGGNSGAPMFVNAGGLRNGTLSFGPNPYRLLGVVSGYFYETTDFHLQVATTLTGTVAANSGIALVVPVDELKTLLDSPELVQRRDAEAVAQTKK